MRNCYVEGKTKFVVPNRTALNYSAYDVIVSFNNDSSSPKELLEKITSDLAIPRSHKTPRRVTLLLGVDSHQGDFSATIKDLRTVLPPGHKLYFQSVKRPESISILDERDDLTDAVRVIAEINC